MHDSVLDDEAGILHWDFTYQAVANIFVQHNGKLVELAYVLGTLLGSRGLVLGSIIAPTEKWSYMEQCLCPIFQRFTRAPEQLWVDDYQKWSQKLYALLRQVFGPDCPTKVGQDWRHFKEIMIAPADHRSQDYPRFKRKVEGLLRRIRLPDEAQNAIATPAQLRAALKDIYDRFQHPLGGAIGGADRRAALRPAESAGWTAGTYPVCSSAGRTSAGTYQAGGPAGRPAGRTAARRCRPNFRPKSSAAVSAGRTAARRFGRPSRPAEPPPSFSAEDRRRAPPPFHSDELKVELHHV